jgi:hypothetical protein
MRPLVALVGIFRDEEASIGALLDSVKGIVDHSSLSDTGSKDKTFSIMLESGVSVGTTPEPILFAPFLPERKIIDFSATRNMSLDMEAQRPDKAVFTLSLSGDETLVEDEPGALRKFLEQHRDTNEDAFCVTMKRVSCASTVVVATTTRFMRSRSARTGRRWAHSSRACTSATRRKINRAS